MIQHRGERVLSENGWKERQSGQRKQEIKGVNRIEKKRVERTLKYVENGERNAKENKIRHI